MAAKKATGVKKQRGEDRFTAAPVEMHNVKRPKAAKKSK